MWIVQAINEPCKTFIVINPVEQVNWGNPSHINAINMWRKCITKLVHERFDCSKLLWTEFMHYQLKHLIEKRVEKGEVVEIEALDWRELNTILSHVFSQVPPKIGDSFRPPPGAVLISDHQKL